MQSEDDALAQAVIDRLVSFGFEIYSDEQDGSRDVWLRAGEGLTARLFTDRAVDGSWSEWFIYFGEDGAVDLLGRPGLFPLAVWGVLGGLGGLYSFASQATFLLDHLDEMVVFYARGDSRGRLEDYGRAGAVRQSFSPSLLESEWVVAQRDHCRRFAEAVATGRQEADEDMVLTAIVALFAAVGDRDPSSEELDLAARLVERWPGDATRLKEQIRGIANSTLPERFGEVLT